MPHHSSAGPSTSSSSSGSHKHGGFSLPGYQHGGHHIGSVVDDWPMYSSQPDDYVLGDTIGLGASSVVYEATFKPLNNRPCAVKVIDLEAFGRDTEELRRETQLMSLSKHPNVLRVRGCWVTGSKLHIATRLMSSGSLLDIMRYSHSDGFPEDVICSILKQALQGLAYLHVNGWLHRDLKAANVLVDEDGTVLVGDFGVGVWVGNSSSLGKRKSFVGTPCWMAPEVVERKHYNAKADIWSFGITAVELSQGHAPHAKLAPVKVLMKTLSEEPPRIDRHNGAHKYSKAFDDFVQQCLRKDPDQRPTAEKLLKHPWLKNAKSPKYIATTILDGLPPLAQRQERQRAASLTMSTRYLQSWDFGASPPGSLRIKTDAAGMSPSASGKVGDPFAGFSSIISNLWSEHASSSSPSPAESSMPSRGSTLVSIDGEHAIAVEDEQDGVAERSIGQPSATDNDDAKEDRHPDTRRSDEPAPPTKSGDDPAILRIA